MQCFLEEERVSAGADGEQFRDGVGKLGSGDRRRKRAAGVVGERAELDLPIPMRVALARSLAQAPGPVLALAPVAEHEPYRSLLRDR